jgi:UDP-glucuronate 4-epimerase
MPILVTGVAGFIGFHTARALLQRGDRVVGVDNVSNYYDVRLKEARLEELRRLPGFTFHKLDIVDRDPIFALVAANRDLSHIIHLAAQAGVRHSLENPYSYVDANVMGTVVILEAARRLDRLTALTYASSSSVYGANKKQPFSVSDLVDKPVSLYAASKRACELTARAYSYLYGLPATGLRFFTAYGPWGRPDMAAWLFTEAILADQPIKVFNEGRMARDFTYIDDIVAGTIAANDRPAVAGEGGDEVAHRIYNLGNHKPELLLDFIATIERALGRRATMQLLPMQPGDVPESFADIDAARRDLGFEPRISIEEGIARFIAWYKHYHQLD